MTVPTAVELKPSKPARVRLVVTTDAPWPADEVTLDVQPPRVLPRPGRRTAPATEPQR